MSIAHPPLERRSLLGLAGAALLAPLAHLSAARAADADPLAAEMSERSFGHPDAKVTVTEFFSLTCTHCAAFSAESMPSITKTLVNTGQVRFVYWDFPLDQVALTAAMVARALPAAEYEPFISALFASQDRWAFAPEHGDSNAVLARLAMLAGLSRAAFDAAIADTALKQAILTRQQLAQDKYHVDSTPTFLCNGRTHAGEMTPDAFAKFVAG